MLNQWSSRALNDLHFDFEENSVSCCIAKRDRQRVKMSQEKMQQIYEFFINNLSKYRIGYASIPWEIYLRTAYLTTSE